MHEISLVEGLFRQLRELAEENNSNRIISVTMEIGPLSGIVVDSFRFGFDVLSAEDDLVRDAELIVKVPPATYTCTNCGYEETTSGSRPDKCRKCSDLFLIPAGGEDLILNRIEME